MENVFIIAIKTCYQSNFINGIVGISLGVGKSSLAATLSMALANMGKKVQFLKHDALNVFITLLKLSILK